jgi:signal transduction histidine kinase
MSGKAGKTVDARVELKHRALASAIALALMTIAAPGPTVAQADVPAAAADFRAALAAARAATERRDWADALPRWKALEAAAPGNVDILIESARVHGFADRNAEAAQRYRQVIELAPSRRNDVLLSLAWQTLWSGDAAAAEAIRLFEAVSTQKGIAMVSMLPNQPIPFEEIPGDFQRLFSNLIDNAIRYTPTGGTVEIEVGCDDRRITISIRDSGMGIEPEYREKIFEEFFRTPRAKQCLAEGTGLGLAIVRGIVNRYHGSIRLESEPGKGTAFFITFPRRKQ